MMYELIEKAEDIKVGDRFRVYFGKGTYSQEYYTVDSIELKGDHFKTGLSVSYEDRPLLNRSLGVLTYTSAQQKIREWYRILDEVPYDPAQEPDDEDDV